MRTILPFLLFLALSLAAVAETKSLQAKFLGIEIGDYYHINVQDVDGNDHSFFVSNDESFDKFIENPDNYKDMWVDLRWHTIEKDIPEAGGMRQIDEATSIEVL